MRLSLRFGLLGVGISVAIALPLASSSVQPASAQTAASQAPSAPAARRLPAKRSATKAKSKTDGSGDAKAARSPAETDRLLDSAAKALADGKPDAAMTTLDGVLGGGGLTNSHMARALYLRGLTHRKKGRSAQAIADLTSAIWLKGGLSEADRTAALKERSEVSRELGIAEAPTPEGQVRTAAPAKADPPAMTPAVRTSPAKAESPAKPAIVARQEPAAQPTPPPAPAVAPSSLVTAPPPPSSAYLSEGGFPRPSSVPAATPRRDASRERSAREPSKAVSSWQSETKVATKDGWVPIEERQKGRAAAPEPGAPGGGPTLGEFLSGLFGGTEPRPTSAPDRPTKTAQVSDWSTSTRGPSKRQAKPKSESIVTSAAPQPSAATPASGGYRLQIAAVRSRTEAEAVVARVRKEHTRVVGSRTLDIDQTVFGNMGTFYRVRLGPFAAASEPKALCDQLRTSGYDCLVVTQ